VIDCVFFFVFFLFFVVFFVLLFGFVFLFFCDLLFGLFCCVCFCFVFFWCFSVIHHVFCFCLRRGLLAAPPLGGGAAGGSPPCRALIVHAHRHHLSPPLCLLCFVCVLGDGSAQAVPAEWPVQGCGKKKKFFFFRFELFFLFSFSGPILSLWPFCHHGHDHSVTMATKYTKRHPKQPTKKKKIQHSRTTRRHKQKNKRTQKHTQTKTQTQKINKTTKQQQIHAPQKKEKMWKTKKNMLPCRMPAATTSPHLPLAHGKNRAPWLAGATRQVAGAGSGQATRGKRLRESPPSPKNTHIFGYKTFLFKTCVNFQYFGTIELIQFNFTYILQDQKYVSLLDSIEFDLT